MTISERQLQFIFLGAIVLIVSVFTLIFRILYFGCFTPEVYTNSSILDTLECKELEMLILTEQTIALNQTLTCRLQDRITTRKDILEKADLVKIYIKKCYNPYFENKTKGLNDGV